MAIKATDAVNPLSIFLPFQKVEDLPDGAVYVEGIATAEVLDSQGEIVSHEASKAAFAAWTDAFQKSTDGASLGNIREMHGPVAAGKAVMWNTDDAAKANIIGVKVVDPAAAAKCRERVYTGFSIGAPGMSVKRQGNVITAYDLSEVSLVDKPACPSAMFSVVKRDGGGADPVPQDPPDPQILENVAATKSLDEAVKAAGFADIKTPAGLAIAKRVTTGDLRIRDAIALNTWDALAEGMTKKGANIFVESDGWLDWSPEMKDFLAKRAAGEVKKDAAAAVDQANTAIGALKQLAIEMLTMPGEPDTWTMEDILSAIRGAISAKISAEYEAKEESSAMPAGAGPMNPKADTPKGSESVTKTDAAPQPIVEKNEPAPAPVESVSKIGEGDLQKVIDLAVTKAVEAATEPLRKALESIPAPVGRPVEKTLSGVPGEGPQDAVKAALESIFSGLEKAHVSQDIITKARLDAVAAMMR